MNAGGVGSRNVYFLCFFRAAGEAVTRQGIKRRDHREGQTGTTQRRLTVVIPAFSPVRETRIRRLGFHPDSIGKAIARFAAAGCCVPRSRAQVRELATGSGSLEAVAVAHSGDVG